LLIGAIPRRPLRRFEEGQAAHIVNGKNDIMVPTINSYILQQQLPDAG
jgi:hypothetical protein